MRYPILIEEGTETAAFGVVVPDLPGCFSAGDTLDEAIEAAQTGWARVPWDAVGVDGETKANESAITVRCLIRPDGSVPASQSESGLTAILARSY